MILAEEVSTQIVAFHLSSERRFFEPKIPPDNLVAITFYRLRVALFWQGLLFTILLAVYRQTLRLKTMIAVAIIKLVRSNYSAINETLFYSDTSYFYRTRKKDLSDL
jgi:hypothetical protein